jgi:hypothetical protein
MTFPDVNWADPAMPGRELSAIRIEAEKEAQNLLFGLAHYAHAQAATAHYGPVYVQQRARLAQLEAERAQVTTAWQEAKATAQMAGEAHARALETNDYAEQANQRQAHAAASQQAEDLARRLQALGKSLEPLRLEVQHAAALLAGLHAVERPALPPWFMDAVRRATRGTGALRL